MPSTSKKQRNFMAAVAHSPAFAKKVGVPRSVGQDFNKADTGKFSKGGDTMASKMNSGFMAMMAKKKGEKMPEALAKHAAKPASKAHAGLKAGGMTKMAKGGGIEIKGKTKGKQIVMKQGGSC